MTPKEKAENKSLRKMAEEIMDMEYSFFTPETRKKMALSFCKGYFLAKKQEIEYVLEFARYCKHHTSHSMVITEELYTLYINKINNL